MRSNKWDKIKRRSVETDVRWMQVNDLLVKPMVLLSLNSNTKQSWYSLDFLSRLNSGQLDRDHAVWVGLADQVGFGAQYVRRCHGGDAVLQSSGAVPTVGEQEGVLRLWLKVGDELLRQLPIHLHALTVIVQDLRGTTVTPNFNQF